MLSVIILADDGEDYEEAGGGNRFMGFMFGNLDNTGDLDIDYLDEVKFYISFAFCVFC